MQHKLHKANHPEALLVRSSQKLWVKSFPGTPFLMRHAFVSLGCIAFRIGTASAGVCRRAVLRRREALYSTTRMSNVPSVPTLVEPSWLAKNLNEVTVLDATYHMAKTGRNASKEYYDKRILGAQRFDIDKICDKETTLPHMIPSVSEFGKAVRALGVSSERPIVVYGRNANYFGAARAWWMLRLFGIDAVGVLNGGFGAWTGPTESGSQIGIDPSDFEPTFNPALVRDIKQMVAHSNNGDVLIVDARGRPRFEGTAEEPRPGMRSGHIPGSISVPYREFIDENGRFLEKDELRSAFKRLGVPLSANSKRPIVATCGSGVSACNVALAMFVADGQQVAIYDGSWSEYGKSNYPVETGMVIPNPV